MGLAKRGDTTWKGILCMLAGGILIVINDAANKWLVADYPVGEVLFLRGILISPFIGVLAWRQSRFRDLGRGALGSQLLRALLVAAVNFLFVAALGMMPLADALALTFAAPLFTAILAGPMLGEVIDWRRWTAIGVGFLGVLLIARPGSATFQLAALLPLAAALCGALKDILTRQISRTGSSMTTLVFSTAVTTMIALATAAFGWRVPTPGDLALFIGAGVVMACAQYLLIEALRLAEATLLAPLIFLELVWSIVIGYLVWGSVPDTAVTFGALIVGVSGVIVIRRKPGLGEPG